MGPFPLSAYNCNQRSAREVWLHGGALYSSLMWFEQVCVGAPGKTAEITALFPEALLGEGELKQASTNSPSLFPHLS